MEIVIYCFISFIIGIFFNSFFGYLYGLGYSTILVKRAISDCLLILAKNVQSIYEVNQLKYMALEMAGKDERYAEFQKSMDDRELSSMKNTAIRNFLNSIPHRFYHVVPFHDWVTAMKYLDEQIKKEK